MDKLRHAWGNLKLYGKGGISVKKHVSHIYSPPRVSSMAERIVLIPGFALDLSVNDPKDNMPWDFNIEPKRVKAEEMVRSKSSLLLVVSPMCAAFSRLHRLNCPKMDTEKVKQLVEYGIKHL